MSADMAADPVWLGVAAVIAWVVFVWVVIADARR